MLYYYLINFIMKILFKNLRNFTYGKLCQEYDKLATKISEILLLKFNNNNFNIGSLLKKYKINLQILIIK